MEFKYTDFEEWIGGAEIKAYIDDWKEQSKYIDLPEEKMFVGELSYSIRNIDNSLLRGFKEVYVLPKKYISSIADYVYLDVLAVDSDFTGYGIGKKLMELFITHCNIVHPNLPIITRASPFREETLNLRNLTKFYEQFGFIVYKPGDKSNFMIRL